MICQPDVSSRKSIIKDMRRGGGGRRKLEEVRGKTKWQAIDGHR